MSGRENLGKRQNFRASGVFVAGRGFPSPLKCGKKREREENLLGEAEDFLPGEDHSFSHCTWSNHVPPSLFGEMPVCVPACTGAP